jgi:heat shock protein HspQ
MLFYTTKVEWTDRTENTDRIRRKKDYYMILVEDQELITRNYKEKNTNGQECYLKRKRTGKKEK